MEIKENKIFKEAIKKINLFAEKIEEDQGFL